jgi:hypothetical protein
VPDELLLTELRVVPHQQCVVRQNGGSSAAHDERCSRGPVSRRRCVHDQ